MRVEREVEPIAPVSGTGLLNRRFANISELREKLHVLARRKWVIIGTVVLALLAASIYLILATWQYTAELQIMSDSEARPMFELKSAVSEQARNEAEIFNQMVSLRSRGLAQQVVDKLRLDQDPEFNKPLRPASLLDQVINAYLPESLLPASRPHDVRNAVVDEFLKRLDTRNIPRSRALEVTFTSADPGTSARVLNILAEAYVDSKLDYKFRSVRRGSSWLAERIEKLRQEVEASEKVVEDYRRQHSLFQTEGSTLIAQQITDLNTKLTDARMEWLAAEANHAEGRRLLNSPDSMGTTAVQVLQSDTIRRFREQELELERKAAEMGKQYGAQHPAMIQLQAQRQELENKLRDEIQRILQSLENQVRIAHMREASLSRDLDALKQREEGSNQALVGLRTLERNAEANRLILQRMMTSFLEATAQNDLESQVPDVRVVSPAPVPNRPSSPRPLVLLTVVSLSAGVLGALLAFALEHWDTGFRRAKQAELVTGLPVLAHVPRAGAVGRGGRRGGEYLHNFPATAFAEAMRALYIRLALAKGQEPPKVVLFISAQTEEGKSTLCLSHARQQALRGRRTIVVDADFRRSSIATAAGLRESPGLSEVLAGSATLAETIQSDPQSPAHVIVAGRQWVDVLIGSSRIGEVVRELRATYDLIVVDTAPVLVISDALLVAQLADAVLMVVRWGRTPEGVVCSALNHLEQSGVRVDGLILSMVDVRKLPSHEYGDYRKYAKYYELRAEQAGAVAPHAGGAGAISGEYA